MPLIPPVLVLLTFFRVKQTTSALALLFPSSVCGEWCVFPGWRLAEMLLPITVSAQWPDASSGNLNKIAAPQTPPAPP